MSINSSLDKQIVAYPLNGFLLRNKRNESLIHATTRILKIITLNERSLMFSSKKEYTLYVNTLQNANKCTARSWGLGERWRGAGGRDMVYTGTQENFGLTILIMVTILQVYTCQKMYQTAYFKYLVYCIAIDLQ